MHTLPVTPVESLAIHGTTRTANPGIVPPWLQTAAPHGNGNFGIVPPWLVKGAATPAPIAPEAKVIVRNPGIVPPWLLTTVVGTSRPVAADMAHMVRAAAQAVAV